MNPNPLFFKRSKMRFRIKIKDALVKLNYQKTQIKREHILKIRQEKLQRFRINYIPLCSDEDWEALSEFYSKNSEE